MIHRHGQSLKLNIPRPANCVGLHVSSRRPKIEVQGLAPVVQVGDENALSQSLKNPAAFARAIEGSRPGFFKQLGVGVLAGLVALEFVPFASLKLLALLGVGLYVGLNIRKHTRYDAIQACLNMINAKEKVIGNMRQLVEGLRQQIREILSEVDRINRMHGADFERLTHLARDEQRPRTDSIQREMCSGFEIDRYFLPVHLGSQPEPNHQQRGIALESDYCWYRQLPGTNHRPDSR